MKGQESETCAQSQLGKVEAMWDGGKLLVQGLSRPAGIRSELGSRDALRGAQRVCVIRSERSSVVSGH